MPESDAGQLYDVISRRDARVFRYSMTKSAADQLCEGLNRNTDHGAYVTPTTSLRN